MNFIVNAEQQTQIEILKKGVASQIPVLIIGPPGCGKTTLVYDMAIQNQKTIIEVSAFENICVQDLVGHYIITERGSDFVKGPLLKAVENGDVFYFDEMGEVDSDVLKILHPLLDHRRSLFIYSSGETIPAHPDFQFIGSYNPKKNQGSGPSEAFRQRCMYIDLDYLDESSEVNLVVNETGLGIDTAKTLVAIARFTREFNVKLVEGASTRLLISAAKLIQHADSKQHEIEIIKSCLLKPLTGHKETYLSLLDGLQSINIFNEVEDSKNIVRFSSNRIDIQNIADF
mgnify:FL=1